MGKVKKVCKLCLYWTKKGKGWYKCYCGDCPAKERDERTNTPPYTYNSKYGTVDKIDFKHLLLEFYDEYYFAEHTGGITTRCLNKYNKLLNNMKEK